jgi:hypothetical protein
LRIFPVLPLFEGLTGSVNAGRREEVATDGPTVVVPPP